MIEVRFDKAGLARKLAALSKRLPTAIGAALKSEGCRLSNIKRPEYAKSESSRGQDLIELVKQ